MSEQMEILQGFVNDMLAVEQAHFVDCIRSGERSSIVTMRDACRGLEAAEAALESLRTGEVVRPGITARSGA